MGTKRRVLVSLIVVVAVLGLGACAKLPQAAVDQADVALSAAGDAEAAVYAQTQWEAAQNAMNAAKAEIEKQNAKFALVRSYTKAEELLADAKKTADEAKQAAIAGKEAMRLEVEKAVATIESDLNTASEHLTALQNCRRRPKGFATDLEMLRGNTEGLKTQLGKVSAAAAAEKYKEADTMAQELKGNVDALLTDLQGARTKLGC
jgi:chromosome segregation ATPase